VLNFGIVSETTALVAVPLKEHPQLIQIPPSTLLAAAQYSMEAAGFWADACTAVLNLPTQVIISRCEFHIHFLVASR